MTRPPERNQRSLPLGEAQGAYDERRNELGLALLRVNADLYLRDFMLWIFNVTDGGIAGSLKKSMKELAQRPWGLCCSPEKVRSTVEAAVAYGWIDRERTRNASGDAGPNAYSLNWDGIRASLDLKRTPGRNRGPTDEKRSAAGYSPPRGTSPAIDRTSPATDQSLKENSSPELLYGIEHSPPSVVRSANARADGDGWTAAERALRGAGADNAEQLVERLRLDGLDPTDGTHMAAVLEANAGAFRSVGGAAWFFLEHGRWPINHLVDPAEFQRRRQREADQAAERKRREDRVRAKLRSEADRDAAIAVEFGAAFDALDDRERDALAVRTLAPLWLKKYRTDGGGAMAAEIKQLLLRGLAAEATQAEASS